MKKTSAPESARPHRLGMYRPPLWLIVLLLPFIFCMIALDRISYALFVLEEHFRRDR